MSGTRVDTSHIKSPRDPMTPEEREAVRRELRDGSEALWRVIDQSGDARDEWEEMFGDLVTESSAHDAA